MRKLLLLLAAAVAAGRLRRPAAPVRGRSRRDRAAARAARRPRASRCPRRPTRCCPTTGGRRARRRGRPTRWSAQELPAVAGPPHPGDWRLVMTAELQGDAVVPDLHRAEPGGRGAGHGRGHSRCRPSLGRRPIPRRSSRPPPPPPPTSPACSPRIEAARLQSDPQQPAEPARPGLCAGRDRRAGRRQQLADARRCRPSCRALGEVVQSTPQRRRFHASAGTVTTKKVAGDQMHVEIKWTVHDAAGTEAGARRRRSTRCRPARSTSYWGDVAVAVADQAAGGIREIILNQADPRRTAPRSAAVKITPDAGKPPPGKTGADPARRSIDTLMSRC